MMIQHDDEITQKLVEHGIDHDVIGEGMDTKLVKDIHEVLSFIDTVLSTIITPAQVKELLKMKDDVKKMVVVQETIARMVNNHVETT